MKNSTEITKTIFKISLICFIAVIFAFSVVIIGVKQVFSRYSTARSQTISESDDLKNLNILILEEHNAISNYVLATQEGVMESYEREEAEIRRELKGKLADFEKKMEGKEIKPIFDSVNLDCRDNFTKIDTAKKVKQENGSEKAADYITRNLVGFNQDFSAKLTILTDEVEKESKSVQKQLYNYLILLIVVMALVVIFIIGVIAVAFITCVRLSARLEKYKRDLEENVEMQSRQIVEKNEKIINIQKNTIIGMANLIENRDGDTGEHVKRTSLYVELLARETKNRGYYSKILTGRYIDLLQKAAPMHDVGKIVVPDAVLKKPGKLTPEEFEEIKKHAAAGGRIVREVFGKIEDPEYVEIASNVANYHHEKWNGSGYPEGLSGEQIPLCARIMAVADVFDALVSPRCYKKPMTIEEAFKIIEDSSGSHFDPSLVEVFLSIKEEILKVLESTNH